MYNSTPTLDTLTIILLIVGLGVPIYMARASFIFLFSNFEPPPVVARALRFVPVAVFVSLIVPELLVVSGQIDFSLFNPKLTAGLIAAVVAWFTGSTLMTLLVGMAAFHLIHWLEMLK